MTAEIHVAAAHLRRLAEQQHHAGAQSGAAELGTVGVTTEVEATHGTIAAAAARALGDAERARCHAGSAVTGLAEHLGSALHTAAVSYTDADAHSEADLRHRRPGR